MKPHIYNFRFDLEFERLFSFIPTDASKYALKRKQKRESHPDPKEGAKTLGKELGLISIKINANERSF